MGRVLRIGAGLALALLISTCRDERVSGPPGPGGLRFNLYGLLAPPPPGQADVPIDSIRVTLQRLGETSFAYDSVIRVKSDTLADSLTLDLDVVLATSPEDMTLDVTTYGQNLAWYHVNGPVTLTAGQSVTVRFTAVYVGPGANAASVKILPVDTTVVGGTPFALHAVVFDPSNNAIAGVPVGYLSRNSAVGTVSVNYLTATFSGATTVRDSVWVVAETPTHQKDSTRVHVVPPPGQLLKVSGDGQAGNVGLALLPDSVRVLDNLGAPFAGDTIIWSVSSGAANLSTGSSVTDAQGYAAVVATPTAAGTVGIRASATWNGSSLSGSPLTFTATVISTAPANIAKVSGDGQSDTVTRALPAPLVVKVTNSSGSALAGVKVVWTRVQGSGALASNPDTTLTDASGLTQTTYALGQTAGIDSVRATVAGTPIFVTFGATAVHDIAAQIAKVSGDGQQDTVGGTLPLPLKVLVSDAFANPVPGSHVAWSILLGGGGLGAGAGAVDTSVTDANGNGQTTFKVGAPPGIDTIQAKLVGTVSVTKFTVTVNSTSPVASTTVTPHLDTLTSLTATGTLAAQAKDASNNPVAGTFTWVSRTPAIATVSPTGMVTAVANGQTYVVATEAGGTKDSALVVVQQRLASITVTPASRTIYLSGLFTFTATAVDGAGKPITSITSFTWSTTASAVAAVDSTGKVTGVGIGAAQIRATSGSVIGVANVNVITPITRIAVVVDTVGAAKTDTFTLTSLGLTRSYRAIAHDTLDNVMTGVAFTWVSSNGSVALLDSITATTARATSAANGVTAIQATAQGFTSNPGAFLTVSQVLASVELTAPVTNPTATIGVSGSVALVARGKDANSRYIAGGSFKYASANPAVATVDSATGVVTGVSSGTSGITASSGVITSNVLTVTVGGAVPAIISFGRDTVSVGRGSSASIPILLSKPDSAALIVNLTAAAYAHWNPATVTIPAGQTSINATLVGDSAGTTTVTAVDGSGAGYASGNAVAKVTANMRLTSSGYSINATDVVVTQVLLSDPSPAGGTYITFSYGTPGIASVSPDPAFIPQGQLAADIQIRGLTGGSTTITPVAVGVNGQSSSFTAYAPVLTPSANSLLLGLGQYDPNEYVYIPAYTNLPVPVTLTSSDTTIATVPAGVTIPSNTYYAYFNTSSAGLGTATISLSSPGWTQAHPYTTTVTTPVLGTCCSNSSLYTTSPQQNVYVYTEDSTGASHPRINSLVVHLRSTDTTVIRMLDTVVTVAPGTYYSSAPRFVMGGSGGTAWIVVSAGGHRSDSTSYTVQGPPLTFSWGGAAPTLGVGQQEAGYYVYTPTYITAPLVVHLTSSDTTILGIPDSVVIPNGSYYAYFTVRGNAPGGVTLTANAAGYQGTSGTWSVTSPRLTACCNYSVNNFGAGTSVTVYSADSLRTTHAQIAPLTVAVVSDSPQVVTVDSTSVTIPAGQYYNNQAHITPVGPGVAHIIFSAAGHPTLDTLTITVTVPKLSWSFYTSTLGRRQSFSPNGNGFYLSTPDYRPSDLAVTISQKHGNVDSLTAATVTIPTSSYYVYLDAFGLATGVDTLIASAPGYLPDTAFLTVTTSQFTSSGLPGSTTTTNPPIGVTVYATDSLGNSHYTMDTVVVAAVSSDSNVIRPLQPFFRITKNSYYTSTTVTVFGPGPASITFSDSAGTGYKPVTTNTITVTGPTLSLANGTPTLGMRQTGSSGTGSSYVYTPNTVATPLVVHLLSTGTRVATVPDSVVIPANSYYVYFDVTALDTVGTIQVQATATGYGSAAMNVQVTQPAFRVYTTSQLNTTSAPATITVQATDANGSIHYPTEPVTVTLVSSAPGVAAIDSTTVTIPVGSYYVDTPRWSPGVVGTAQIQASDQRAVYYKYNSYATNVSVVTPTLSMAGTPGTLGIGQYVDYMYVYTPDYAVAPITVTLSHPGTARTATYDNQTTNPITSVVIPAGNYYAYFRMAATTRGADTLVASATSPAFNPVTTTTVIDSGRIDPIGSWPTAIAAGDSVQVTLYARDPSQNVRAVLNTTTFSFSALSNIEFHAGGQVITSIDVPAGQSSVTFYLKGVSAGTGSATITQNNYKTFTNTVTVTP